MIDIGIARRDDASQMSIFAGRAKRNADNTVENFILFAPLALAAQVSGVDSSSILFGAQLFLWSRLVYSAVYLIGIPYLRSVVWAASIAGLVVMMKPIL